MEKDDELAFVESFKQEALEEKIYFGNDGIFNQVNEVCFSIER
jgi:hypothetical protein